MNYYSMQGPAQYAQSQQSRQDQQMSNLLRMMMQMKQFKEKQRQWGENQQFKREQLEVNRKRQEATEKYYEHLAKPKPPTPTAVMKTVDWMVETGIAPNRKVGYDMYRGFKDPERIRIEAQARAEGIAAGKPQSSQTITTYDKKKTDLEKAYQEGKISQEEYTQGKKTLLGISTTSRKDTTYVIRDKNEAFVQRTLGDMVTKDIIKAARQQIKGLPDAIPVLDGVRLDMPFKYNVAKFNEEDNAQTEADKRRVLKYDAMFQAFRENVLPRFNSFKEFMASNKGKDWDLKQVRLWFDIYR